MDEEPLPETLFGILVSAVSCTRSGNLESLN
eukprot:SAG25_NODE_11268_length_309_cov_0.733333_1_plen_30_part_10